MGFIDTGIFYHPNSNLSIPFMGFKRYNLPLRVSKLDLSIPFMGFLEQELNQPIKYKISFNSLYGILWYLMTI